LISLVLIILGLIGTVVIAGVVMLLSLAADEDRSSRQGLVVFGRLFVTTRKNPRTNTIETTGRGYKILTREGFSWPPSSATRSRWTSARRGIRVAAERAATSDGASVTIRAEARLKIGGDEGEAADGVGGPERKALALLTRTEAEIDSILSVVIEEGMRRAAAARTVDEAAGKQRRSRNRP